MLRAEGTAVLDAPLSAAMLCKMRELPGWTLLINPILEHLDRRPGASFTELRQQLATTVSILTRALQELRHQERVHLQGLRRDARYYLGIPLRIAGPLPLVLHPPISNRERASVQERLAAMRDAHGLALPRSERRRILDVCERELRARLPTLAANDPLATEHIEMLASIRAIRKDQGLTRREQR